MRDELSDTPQDSRPRPRLVVADDDAFVCAMLVSSLEYRFECVGRAGDAMDAIALVDAQRPDVAILDVVMPAGGALFATQGIRSRCPETAIVILSGDYSEDTAAALIEAGASAYLHKDIDPHILGVEIAAALDYHHRTFTDEATVTTADAA
jgi:DNA-binding NarL/FixJ family response regulator